MMRWLLRFWRAFHRTGKCRWCGAALPAGETQCRVEECSDDCFYARTAGWWN